MSGTGLEAIVIGASAGGVEALMRILPALPRDLGLPVFVVIHLPRDRPSLLADIFADKCRLAVAEAIDKQPIEPGTLYFAPPDYHLMIERDEGDVHLALSADPLVNYSRPSIDVLFETAADAYGEALLGVILTGANHDGAVGLRAVRQAGGRTVVQTPEAAQATAMIEAALALTPDASILSLEQIASMFSSLAPTRQT